MTDRNLIVTATPWTEWRSVTPARLALGRAGAGMPTDETLRFGLAHAMARDAIHTELDVDALASALAADGWQTARARSQAPDRATYLHRPDLGRRLDADDAVTLQALNGNTVTDLCIVVGDGLSSVAAARHAVPLLAALRALLPPLLRIAPVVIASQARVALADDIGEQFGSTLAMILLGERPGLSSPDSLGMYLTWGPRRGRSDAQRNCVSNIRPEGLPYAPAARRIAWLIGAAGSRGLTGVELKDDSDAVLTTDAAQARMTGPSDSSRRGFS